MNSNSIRAGGVGSHPDLPLSGWQRVVGLLILGTVTTIVTIKTGSAESAVVVTTPLLGFILR